MAPKPTAISDPAGHDTALPQAIIAQAGAAIAANAPTSQRRPSQATSGSTQHQDALQDRATSSQSPLTSEISDPMMSGRADI